MNEELIYESIATEIENGKMRKGIWAMALAKSQGNIDKTNALYIELRYK